MKWFIIADGVIQGVLAAACILAWVYLFFFSDYFHFPIHQLYWVLLGWQTISSFIHIFEGRQLVTHKGLYYLQLILLAFSLLLSIALILTHFIVLSGGLRLVSFYFFYGGIFLLLPVLCISIAVISIRRLFLIIRQKA
ncbi:hypothetical protein [Chitinophaga sp. RAB17]|uniref:hypothetical protein n=1 Tax=Chitinophaga sp. RAB17 TaxID=3233049 RepID=UPI003F910901